MLSLVSFILNRVEPCCGIARFDVIGLDVLWLSQSPLAGVGRWAHHLKILILAILAARWQEDVALEFLLRL